MKNKGRRREREKGIEKVRRKRGRRARETGRE